MVVGIDTRRVVKSVGFWRHVGETHMDRGGASGCMQPPIAIKLMGIDRS